MGHYHQYHSHPHQFCVGRGVVREASYLPKVGIGQGDPLSPVLFSFCISFVLHQLSTKSGLSSYMYAPDLCSIIEGTNLVHSLCKVQDAMNVFAKFSGQVLNLIKRGIVIKGVLTPTERGKIEVTKDIQLLLGIPTNSTVEPLKPTTPTNFSAARREADGQPIDQLARLAVNQTGTNSLGFLSAADPALSSGEAHCSEGKQWPNGNAANHRLFGRRFEPRSGEDGGGAADESPPTKIRTADLKFYRQLCYCSTGV